MNSAKLGSGVCGMPAGHDNIEHRVCVQRVPDSAKVEMFNDHFWFQILVGTVSTLTGQTTVGSLHDGERHLRTPLTGRSRTSASLLGKFAGRCLLCRSQGNRRSVPWSSEREGCLKPHCLMHSVPLVCTSRTRGKRSHKCHPQRLSRMPSCVQ